MIRLVKNNSNSEPSVGKYISSPITDWSQIGDYDHFVQFYESDKSLLSTLSNYIASAINLGKLAFVVITSQHRDALNLKLQELGIDVDLAISSGKYILLDANETLPKIMLDGMPDAGLFNEFVGSFLDKISSTGFEIRAFGEMVSILWAESNYKAAICLEQMWNELQQNYKLSLFCAYPVQSFNKNDFAEPLREICLAHSKLIIPLDISAQSRNEPKNTPESQQKMLSPQDEVLEHERVESMLAAIVEYSADAIISKTLNGTITSWNKGAELIFGYKADEVIGKSITILIPRDRLGEEAIILSKLKRGEHIAHYETTRIRKDGTPIIISLTVSPIKDGNGNIIGASKIARDITERRELEKERAILLEKVKQENLIKEQTIKELNRTQQELSRLASIVEFSYDPIISLGLDGVILSWNKSAEKVYGHTTREIVGRHISTLFPSQYLSDIPKILMPLDRGEAVNDFETIQITKDGNLLNVSLTAFPVKDERGNIDTASIIVRDLTERKHIERERAKLLASGH